MVPRGRLLVPHHAPTGYQQLCLTRQLIPQSIKNSHLHAHTNSLCTFLVVPRCRCLPLGYCMCRESCKRSLVSHPKACVPPLRWHCFVVTSPSQGTCTTTRLIHAFPLASGMLPSTRFLPIKPAFPCYPCIIPQQPLCRRFS